MKDINLSSTGSREPNITKLLKKITFALLIPEHGRLTLCNRVELVMVKETKYPKIRTNKIKFSHAYHCLCLCLCHGLADGCGVVRRRRSSSPAVCVWRRPPAWDHCSGAGAGTRAELSPPQPARRLRLSWSACSPDWSAAGRRDMCASVKRLRCYSNRGETLKGRSGENGDEKGTSVCLGMDLT